jgi:hypothetical protein
MAQSGDEDPKYTIIVVGDDGQYYKLTKKQWQAAATPLTEAEKGIVSQLTKWGSYLSYIPTSLAVGIGSICIIVNQQAILKNQEDPHRADPSKPGDEPKDDKG